MIITKIEQAKKNESRVNIYLDNEFWIGLDKNELLKFNLFKGKEISEDERLEIEKSSTFTKLVDKVLRYINIRPRSIKELKDYLKRKDTDDESIENVIKYAEDKGYISDLKFAEWYAKNRFSFGKHGVNKIKAELIKKGVKQNIINNVLSSETYKSEEFIDEQLDNIKEYAKKALKSIKHKDKFDLKQKLIKRLLSRGYEYSQIKKVIEELLA